MVRTFSMQLLKGNQLILLEYSYATGYVREGRLARKSKLTNVLKLNENDWKNIFTCYLRVACVFIANVRCGSP
jgi:hypothetical protein